MSRADLVPVGRPDCPICEGRGREIVDPPMPEGRRFVAPAVGRKGIVIECSCVPFWSRTVRSLPPPSLSCAACQASGWVHGFEGTDAYAAAPLRVPTASGCIIPCACRRAETRAFRDFSATEREFDELFD